MARKKNVIIEDVPVDKMDLFIRKNYKKILIATIVVIAVFAGGYTIQSVSAGKNAASAEIIGETELKGLFSDDQIAGFSALADKVPFAKDYIHLTAAQRYYTMGNKEAAVKELNLVGGKYIEMANGLKFDMGVSNVVDTADMTSGLFSDIWYYRAILNAQEGQRGQLIADYKKNWPASKLLDKIEKWNLK